MITDTITYNLGEFQKFVKKFVQNVQIQEQAATIIALSGDLGTGKTTFTQILARELGITDPITSPTFTIAEFYRDFADNRWRQLIHIDAYRLESKDQLDMLGYPDWVADPANLIVIEWPEQIGLTSDDAQYFVTITHGEIDEERIISI